MQYSLHPVCLSVYLWRVILASRYFFYLVGERRLGEQMAESLKKIISPYLLRRTKAEVKAASRARGEDGTVVVGPE